MDRGLPAALLRLARPKQWLKNILVFAAPAAAGILDEGDALEKTAVAFVCFCLAASGTYYLNDALDVVADRAHPTKRNRPVASGVVSVRLAELMAVALLIAPIGLSFVASWRLAVVVASYAALTVAYSTWLKNEAVVDLAAVAAGFVLRTIAGGVAVGVPISQWFLIVAGAGSMFMVTGKRHAEILELGDDAVTHRPSLAHYSLSYLTYVRGVASAIAIGASTGVSVYEAERLEAEIRMAKLERAMLSELKDTDIHRTLRLFRTLLSLVNFAAPLLVFALTAAPLMLNLYLGWPAPRAAAEASVFIAIAVVFAAGFILGKVAGRSPFRQALRMTVAAVLTFLFLLAIESVFA